MQNDLLNLLVIMYKYFYFMDKYTYKVYLQRKEDKIGGVGKGPL